MKLKMKLLECILVVHLEKLLINAFSWTFHKSFHKDFPHEIMKAICLAKEISHSHTYYAW